MKNVHYILLTSLVCINMSFVSAHTTITDKVVVEKSRAIKQMIIRHNYVVGGMMALGYIHQLTYLLPMLKDSAEYFFGDENKKTVIVEQHIPKNESLGFFAGIAKDTKELFGTARGWRRIGDAGLYLAGQVGTFFVFQKMADMAYHPDTLRWYVHAHVPYLNTIKIIENVAKKLDENTINNSMSQEQCVYYASVLSLSCEQLVGYGEDICAYTAYKGGQLQNAQKILAEKTCRYLLNYQNEVFKTLFDEIGKEKPDYNVVKNIMQSYKNELKYQRKLFSSIEAEMHEELQSVGRFS